MRDGCAVPFFCHERSRGGLVPGGALAECGCAGRCLGSGAADGVRHCLALWPVVHQPAAAGPGVRAHVCGGLDRGRGNSRSFKLGGRLILSGSRQAGELCRTVCRCAPLCCQLGVCAAGTHAATSRTARTGGAVATVAASVESGTTHRVPAATPGFCGVPGVGGFVARATASRASRSGGAAA